MKVLPYIIGAGATIGISALALRLFTADVHTFKDVPLDYSPPPPGKTGRKLVDALLSRLQALSSQHDIPLGVLVGWIVKESGGKLAEHPQPGPGDTLMDERGYGQLSPAESKKLGIDHQRLSTDSDYSLQALVSLIHEYEGDVLALKISSATKYGAFYWLLVKLCHTVGVGQTKKWVEAARDAGAIGSWSDFEAFVLSKSWRGPQPKKWLPFMDSLYAIGKPFGFGTASSVGPAVAGLSMRARQRASGTWVVDGGGRPGRFPGGRAPLPRPTGLVGIDVFVS
jgi:hypothetical protein